MKNPLRIITAVIFTLTAAGILILIFFPQLWPAANTVVEERQPRIIIPRTPNVHNEEDFTVAELMAREESISSRIPLEDGEIIISVLNENIDGGPMEKQFVAYRNLLEIDSPIYITFIDYDESTRSYKRVWSAPSAATRPGTINLYTMDLLGDRSVCVILSGMNGVGEHTLSIYRLNPLRMSGGMYTAQMYPSREGEFFSLIAELRIDGNISVKESNRSQAYQMGISRGESFTISAFGRDFNSTNIMDQIEITYAYNAGSGLYEQRNITYIPGTQIEQRRVQELLGSSKAFEEFVTGLWYFITPQGSIDKNQYIYFNPPGREIIFFGDGTQQVFTWQNSTATRYGLYVAGQNISVSTLRRFIDIELESFDSVKIRVLEDVSLKFRVSALWDGSYRKANPLEIISETPVVITAHIDASYDSSIGKLRFFPDGRYELHSGPSLRTGKYAFFTMNRQELLELRPDGAGSNVRETYLVEGETQDSAVRQSLTLLRVRIGVRGIEMFRDGSILLTLAQ